MIGHPLAAEDIGGVDRSKGTKLFGLDLLGIAIQADGLHHRQWCSPQPHQVASDLGMAGAEDLHFGFPKRDMLLMGKSNRFAVLVGSTASEYELADIVQHACQAGIAT